MVCELSVLTVVRVPVVVDGVGGGEGRLGAVAFIAVWQRTVKMN